MKTKQMQCLHVTVIVVIFTLFVVPSHGGSIQNPSTNQKNEQDMIVVGEIWHQTFGGLREDICRSVQQTTPDGGYILVGYTSSFGAGGNDIWLVKTDSTGNKLWDKTFGGVRDDEGYAVQQTTDGGYIIVGATNSSGADGKNVWLIKTDSSGTMLWDKTFNYGAGTDDVGFSVQQTSDGGYVIVGIRNWYGVWFIKTDSTGNNPLLKDYYCPGLSIAYSVVQTSDGGYMIAGAADQSTSSINSWLIRTDASGNSRWQKYYGGERYDAMHAVQQIAPDGAYISVGTTCSYGAGGDDVWLIKTHPQGYNAIWEQTFGGPGDDVGYSVQQTSDGGFIITGYTGSYLEYTDVWLLKTDSDGYLTWDRRYGGAFDDVGYSVQQTSDGGYVIAGFTRSYGAGNADFWLIKVPNAPSEVRCEDSIQKSSSSCSSSQMEMTFDISSEEHINYHFTLSDGNFNKEIMKNDVVDIEHSKHDVPSNLQPNGVPPGSYEYVIITQDSWVSAFQPLAQWKTKKGIPANIVTTTWIYNNGGYSGTNVDKIKAFVQDVNINWGTKFVLLGGDSTIIPCHYKTYASVDPNPIPNDAYYADYNNDYVCDVNLGRAPVATLAHVNTFVNKIITYEKNPPLTEYAMTAFFAGFDLSSQESGEGTNIMQFLKNLYLSTWTYRREYDSENTDHRAEVLTNLNRGYHIINHADLSHNDLMGTGSRNHNQHITTDDTHTLTNGAKQSIIYSMGSLVCNFTDDECIAEGFLRNPNGGAIAVIGYSGRCWYYPMNIREGGHLFNRNFFKALFVENSYKLGEIFSKHKNNPRNTDSYRYLFTSMTLLGDPELPVWKENPTTIDSVSYPTSIMPGSQLFTVTVIDNTLPVRNALVCIQKPGQFYMNGTTDANGQITFTINPTTPGIIDVTVTKQNLVPWEGTANVITALPPQAPTHSDGAHTHDNPGDLHKGIGKKKLSAPGGLLQRFTTTSENTGSDLYYTFYFGDGSSSMVGPISTGQVAVVTHDYNALGTFQVTVTCRQGVGGVESPPSNPTTVTMYLLGDTNADASIDFEDINPFVVMLSDGKDRYYNLHPNGYYYTGDCNLDNQLNFDDINPFVVLLCSGR